MNKLNPTMSWHITEDDSGTKLQAFLKKKLGIGYSVKAIKRALESNLCLINNRIERFGTTALGLGDVVTFRVETPVIEQKPSRPLVLFEDSYFLCIDKPPGFTSDDPVLLKSFQDSSPFLELMHRLDRTTSGVLIFAKSLEASKEMLSLFKKRGIEKSYLAIVDGTPKTESGHIENYIGKIHAYEGQSLWGSVPKEEGKLAITDWKIKKKLKNSSLIICHPYTGRTHQIRVHLSEMGHPILGDKQYGKRFKCEYFPKRCLLHAKSVIFLHPFTQKRVIVDSTIPPDFDEAIQALK